MRVRTETRTQTRTQHLTDAEFCQLLDGAQPSALAEAHLGSCDLCREELSAVQISLGSFRTFSTAWAEVEAPRRVAVPSRWLTGLHMGTSWGAGLAATGITTLLAFWLGVPGQPVASRPTGSAIHQAAIAPTNAELAADNDLLLSIGQELSAPGQPEMSAERLQVTPTRSEPGTAGSMTD